MSLVRARRRFWISITTLAAMVAAFTAFTTLSSTDARAEKADKTEKAFKMPTPSRPGNVDAPQGGTFIYNLRAEPATLNPITGTDLYTERIRTYVTDRLLERDPETHELIPNLAEKYEISPDGQTFTFTLRKDAKWHDGPPVTAEDIKFSYDVAFDPVYGAAHLRPYFEGIRSVEIVDPLTIRFHAKEKYFGNLALFGEDMFIFPKHIYGDAEAGKKKNKTIVGSGPYKLEQYDQGQSLVLVRNKEWWGNKVEFLKGKFNFERLRFRFIKDDNITIEMLKKGDLDFSLLLPEDYMRKTDTPEWGKSVLKVKAENLESKEWGYIGWNEKHESRLFKDRDVRMALFELLNRAEMNKQFRFDMSLLATGPWYQQNPYADPSLKPVAYDPKKAVELLKKAGWTDTDKDGVLDKVIDGKKRDFRFTLVYGDPISEKYFVMYQADLKKVGIDMQLQMLEWNALLKLAHDRKFEAIYLGWGNIAIDHDPKQVWHSSSITAGGSNYVGYSNPEVDRMIDEARGILDNEKRKPILRKVYRIIAEDAANAVMFNNKYVLYARSARIGVPKPTLKYEIGFNYWWVQK